MAPQPLKGTPWLLRTVAAGFSLALALVFLAYTRPDFVVTMVNQLWLCVQ